MKILIRLLFLLPFTSVYSQPNCEAFRYYYKDTIKYEACKKAEEINGLYQFSKEYQQILDESIKIDSTFAYAYRKKSVAYLKSGDFITWKKLMDNAVKYNPQDNLDYRGLMRYRCFRDYRGAIEDFEKLKELGFRTDHLGLAKALCYKMLGEREKAIEILEPHMKEEDFQAGLYDYLHLGVLYLEQKEYEKAIESFKSQSEENELAENQYYLALAYKALEQLTAYKNHLEQAKKLYIEERRMFQMYIDPIDKIYLQDIEAELKKALHGSG
ncbi:MAG: hypothetical protein AAGA77_21585 [Bacteroidota bacterium]